MQDDRDAPASGRTHERELGPVHPDDHEDAEAVHRWLNANRDHLARLRRRGRDWGAHVPASDAPPTVTERWRIEAVRFGRPPERNVLRAFSRDRLLVRGAAAAAEPVAIAHMLFGDDFAFPVQLPRVVRDALDVVAPNDLALAIRAWEPDLSDLGIRKRYEAANAAPAASSAKVSDAMNRHRIDALENLAIGLTERERRGNLSPVQRMGLVAWFARCVLAAGAEADE